jgi:hypothetical protein
MVAAAVLVSTILSAGAAAGDEAIVTVQESRTRSPGKKTVQHVAIVKNRSERPVHGLRVMVELHDYFGAILWARSVVPVPASLRPGETATLTLVTPELAAYRRTIYRFEYRAR